jgi:hypothetical protein
MSKYFKTVGISFATLAVFYFGLTCTEITPTKPVPDDFVYPMNVGNVWNYSGINRGFNVRPDSLASDFEFTFIEHSNIEIISDTALMDSIDVFDFAEIFVQEHRETDTFYSESYFTNHEDGLYYYGRTGSNSEVIPYKINPGKMFFQFNGKKFDNLNEIFSFLGHSISPIGLNGDSISYILPPRKSLHYPLSEGVRWLVYDVSGLFTINKEVVGITYIDVPAGRFLCYKVRWLWDMDEDGGLDSELEYYDYISTVGLVKRTMIARDVILGSYEHPAGIGTIDLEFRFELTDYIIQ